MQLYEVVDFNRVVRGIPVTQEHADYWHILVGQWQEHRINDRNVWQLHGFGIPVEGVQFVIGTDGVTRVFEGQLMYRNNRVVLGPSEVGSDDGRAVVLLQCATPPRNLVSTSTQTGDVKRWLNGNNVDVWCTYDEQSPLLKSLMTVRSGSRLWTTEERKLRVAGTGASLRSWFNFAKYMQVTSTGNIAQISGVTFSDLDAAFQASAQNGDAVSVEAWHGEQSAVFTVSPALEVGEIRRKAAEALGVRADLYAPKYEEVAR